MHPQACAQKDHGPLGDKAGLTQTCRGACPGHPARNNTIWVRDVKKCWSHADLYEIDWAPQLRTTRHAKLSNMWFHKNTVTDMIPKL